MKDSFNEIQIVQSHINADTRIRNIAVWSTKTKENQHYIVSLPDLFLGLVLVAKALKSISTGGGHEDAGVAEFDKFEVNMPEGVLHSWILLPDADQRFHKTINLPT